MRPGCTVEIGVTLGDSVRVGVGVEIKVGVGVSVPTFTIVGGEMGGSVCVGVGVNVGATVGVLVTVGERVGGIVTLGVIEGARVMGAGGTKELRGVHDATQKRMTAKPIATKPNETSKRRLRFMLLPQSMYRFLP